MPPAGFEITVPASERPQTDTLDRAATGIGCCVSSSAEIMIALFCFNSRLPCWFGIFFCVCALRVCISDKHGCSYFRPFFPSSVFHFPVLRSYCQLSLSTLFPSTSNVRFDEAEAACCGRLCSLARVCTLSPFSGHGCEYESQRWRFMCSPMCTLVDGYQHFGGKLITQLFRTWTPSSLSAAVCTVHFRRNIALPYSTYKHEVSKICGSAHLIKNSVNWFYIVV
jgi:hypothetical protein